jgi:general secretion pathway protein G
MVNMPKGQRGFTLIEIMVVVVIIGVLGAIVVPQFMGRPDQAKVTAAKTDVQAVATSLEMYRLEQTTGRHPGAEELEPSGLPEKHAGRPVGDALSILEPGCAFRQRWL